MKKWIGVLCLTGVVLGLPAAAGARDINPMDMHHKRVEAEQVMNEPVLPAPDRQAVQSPVSGDAWALGRELTESEEGLPPAMRKEIGELAVEEAQARVIDNIPINKARTALSTAAGDYEALKVRYDIRSRMLPAWREEREKLLGRPESWDASLQKLYEQAYKDRENVLRFYNGDFDPDQLLPYQKKSQQSLAVLEEGLTAYASRIGAADGVRYGKTVLLSMDDDIQVKLLGERLKTARANYETAAKNYEKLYARQVSRCMENGQGLLIPNSTARMLAPSVMTGSGAAAAGLLPRSEEERQAAREEIERRMAAISNSDWEQTGKRRAQYGMELANLGYFDREAAGDQSTAQVAPPTIPDKRFKIDGEARLDYGANHGKETIGDRARARVRIYGDYNIDDNWHFISMLENEKILHGRDDDNWMDLDRYYLSGNVGAVHLDAGAFGSYLAEGNIYDSKFTGIRVTGNHPVSYMAEAGTIRDAGFAAAAEAYLPYGDYTLGAGLYRFDLDYAKDRTIFMVNLHHPLGLFDAGLMGLVGDDSDTDKKGYVATLSRGEERTWDAGNFYYFLKYYYQPYTTYVSHTMEGMADYMHGFKGLGLGWHYTVAPNWLLQAEYYNLKDLENGDRNHTLWLALSYYFSNYTSN